MELYAHVMYDTMNKFMYVEPFVKENTEPMVEGLLTAIAMQSLAW